MRRSLRMGTIVLLGLALGGCAWLFTPLEAVLAVTPTSGTAPLSVTFSAAGSTGSIVSLTIDFETDGTADYTGTDITVGVNHMYTSPGSYTATLTVQDNRGRTDTDSVTVTVSAPPTTTVSLGAIPASGSAPLNVAFWANIQAAPGRRIKHVALDYDDDGTPEDEVDVDFDSYNMFIGSYTYATPDTYVARLTVRDDATPPQSFSATATITVTSPPPEITTFRATDGGTTVNFDDLDPTLAIIEGTTVDFDLAASAAAGRKVVKYTLLCPGSDVPSATEEGLTGNTLTRNDLMRDYDTAGEYTATLRVWDDVGNLDEATLTIEVTAAP